MAAFMRPRWRRTCVYATVCAYAMHGRKPCNRVRATCWTPSQASCVVQSTGLIPNMLTRPAEAHYVAPKDRPEQVPNSPLPTHPEQVLGGNGYISEYPTGRLLRDAKLYEIGAGTSEIRRFLIGRELVREATAAGGR